MKLTDSSIAAFRNSPALHLQVKPLCHLDAFWMINHLEVLIYSGFKAFVFRRREFNQQLQWCIATDGKSLKLVYETTVSLKYVLEIQFKCRNRMFVMAKLKF